MRLFAAMQIRKANVLSCVICPYLSFQTCVGSLTVLNRHFITTVMILARLSFEVRDSATRYNASDIEVLKKSINY